MRLVLLITQQKKRNRSLIYTQYTSYIRFELLEIQTRTHYYVTEKIYKNTCISSIHLTFNICIQGIKNTHVERLLYILIIQDLLKKYL